MEKNIKLTIEEFLKMELNQISQCYLGKDRCCRCGCGGEYTFTSFHISPRADINDTLVAKRLNRAKNIIRKGGEYEIGDNHINVVTGLNRALTLYFDEVKN